MILTREFAIAKLQDNIHVHVRNPCLIQTITPTSLRPYYSLHYTRTNKTRRIVQSFAELCQSVVREHRAQRKSFLKIASNALDI